MNFDCFLVGRTFYFTVASVENVMIRASAGSGKTYQLANRYLALMVLGVKPERVIALTFTKKAAGEFADRILSKLAEGAESDLNAKKLREELSMAILGDVTVPPLVEGAVVLPEMDVDFFRSLLERVVRVMDQLALSTLDSFFIKLLRNFAFELGMSGFELVQGSDLEAERMRVFADIFERSQGGGADISKGHMKEFVAAFRQSSAGEESIRLTERLKEFVKDHQYRWLKFPQRESWGNADKLWKDGDNSGWPKGGNYREKVRRVRDLLEGVSFGHKTYIKSLNSVCDGLEEREGKSGTPLKVGGRFSHLMAALEELKEGSFTDVFSKKEMVIDGELADAFYQLLGGLVSDEINAKLERTQGVYEVIKAYEERYGSSVRGQGRLGFADATLLLSGHESVGLWDEVSKDLVEFRFDGKYDHWMLDEFQDTSRSQWQVIENLIDEVVNDLEGERSLFVVGDTKQGIYGWRGGEPKLFEELATRYDERLSQWPMNKSYRSAGPVIDLVNRVCDPKTSKGLKLFPSQAVHRWKFEEHSIADFNKDKAGHSWVCEMDKVEDLTSGEVRMLWIGALVEKLDPVRNGISCAILVRKNDHGAEIAEYLREHHADIPVAVENEALVAEENPVSAVIVDAFRFLCYPADTLAWWHIEMSPFRQVFSGFTGSDDTPSKQSVWYHWMRQISEKGLDKVLTQWINSLTEKVEISHYSKGKLEEMELAAAQFVAKGGFLTEWLLELEQWTQREVTRAGVVQIMTVHKAKGLEFGAVIIPDLDNRDFDDESRLKILTHDDDGGHVMLPPVKDVRQADPALRDQVDDWSVDQCYEQFCVLYVMLTRAESGTYCLLDGTKNKPDKRKRNEADWIRESVDGLVERDENLAGLSGRVTAEFGDWEWLETLEKVNLESVSENVVNLPVVEPRKSAVIATANHGDYETNYSSRLMDSKGMSYGTLVHECFQTIEWWDGNLVWNKDKSVVKVVLECMQSPTILPYFEKRDAIKVFREQPIEAIVDGVWISGVIDRLILSYDDSGNVEYVAIVDFKTDMVDDVDELKYRYSDQLMSYQTMLESIYALESDHFYRVIISTHLRKAVIL